MDFWSPLAIGFHSPLPARMSATENPALTHAIVTNAITTIAAAPGFCPNAPGVIQDNTTMATTTSNVTFRKRVIMTEGSTGSFSDTLVYFYDPCV